MSTVVIGKSSFLASLLRKQPVCGDWLFLSHDEALADRAWTAQVSCVVNFAFNPVLKNQGYAPEHDIDSEIALLIRNSSAHYIMISSRAVYGVADNNNPVFNETDTARPVTTYGKNKLATEEALASVLGSDRVTILRASNIFGQEKGRQSFFGLALTGLAEGNKILFDISPFALRDFLSLRHFTDAIIKIADKPQPGLYNLGAGFGIPCGLIAEWLCEGFGRGHLVITDFSYEGQFYLDMAKTRTIFGIKDYSVDELRADCLACGRVLQDQL